MEEHVRYVQDCYYSRPAVLWLPAFLRPDRLFSAVVQTHARQTFQDVADIMLTFKVSVGRTMTCYRLGQYAFFFSLSPLEISVACSIVPACSVNVCEYSVHVRGRD